MEELNFKEGFLQIVENAKRLYMAGEYLSKKKEFAIASSLLILGAEEAVKALYIFSYSHLGIGSDSELKKIFKDHNYKISNIKQIVILNRIFNKYNEIITNSFKTKIQSKEDLMKIRSICIEDFGSWLNQTANSKNDETSILLGWWSNAKSLKENGLYVDFSNEKWISPNQIGKSQFSKTKKNVDYIFTLLENVIEIDDGSKAFNNFLIFFKERLRKN